MRRGFVLVVDAAPNYVGRATMTEPDLPPARSAGAADQWLTPGRFALFLGLLILAAFPAVLVGGRTFVIRDFGMFGYPLAYFHRESFWRGELPLWNPLSNCGLPFLAQWNTLTLYPPSLIYLLLPLAWSVSFFCLAHLFWGGLGMYVLACRWTQCRLAAALAGIIFAFNGLSLNALMWPNIEATLGWLPWVIYLAQRGWREGGRAVVWAVLAGAMQMLAGGPEPILFTWLILFVLACGDWLSRAVAGGRILLRFGLLGLLVTLVCAVQLLPFLQLLAHSQRDSGFTSASHDWSMPPWGWANFLVPLFRTSPSQGVFFQNGQYWTSSYYAGIATLLLAAVAVRRVRDWRVRVLAGLVFLGAVLALGEGTLLYSAVHACFPGIGFLRYPVKAVTLVLALAPLLAAFGVAALTSNAQRAGKFEAGCAALLLLFIAAIVGWDRASHVPADVWQATWRSGLSRAAFLVLVFLFGAAFLKSAGLRQALLGFLLLVVCWLDLLTHAPTQNPTVQPFVYTRGLANAHLKWDPPPRPGRSRAMLAPAARQFLRSNPLPAVEATYVRNRLAARADCNLLDNVPQIDGFFSLTPREVSRVTALPYDQPNREFPALLDFLGVSQTTVPGSTVEWAHRPTAMPLVTAGQQPFFADDRAAFDALLQTNLDLGQVVYLPLEAREAITAQRQPAARARLTGFANQKVFLETEAPAASLVVVSQAHYPAWKAYVDGRPVKLWRANYAFQALQVPSGRHNVQLLYEDRALLAGALLSGVGLLACAGLWWRMRERLPQGADCRQIDQPSLAARPSGLE
jgi:Bacterial membrane protein YfhO